MKKIWPKIRSILKYLLIFVIGAGILIFLFITLASSILNHRVATIEQEIGNLLQSSVHIQNVQAQWQGIHFNIVMNSVAIDNKKLKNTINIKEVDVNINVLHYIWNRQMAFDFIRIRGVQLSLNQVKNSKFCLGPLSCFDLSLKKAASKNFNLIFPYAEWLLIQPQFILQGVEIKILKDSQSRVSWIISELNLSNRYALHRLDGKIRLVSPNAASNKIPTQLDIHLIYSGKGQFEASDQLKLYFKLNHFSFAEAAKWIQTFYPTLRVNSGNLSGQFWLNYQEGQWSSIQSVFQLDHAQIGATNTHPSWIIPSLAGNIKWLKTDSGWLLTGDPITLNTTSVHWINNRFAFAYNDSIASLQQVVWLEHFNITDYHAILSFIKQFWPRINLIKNISDVLISLQPQGQLTNIEFRHEGRLEEWNHYQVQSLFQKVQIQSWHSFPEIKGLSGSVVFNESRGTVFLDSQAVHLNFGPLFPQPFLLDHLTGQLHWKQTSPNNWMITADPFDLSDEAVSFSGKWSLQSNFKSALSSQLNLLSGFSVKQADQVKNYLPIGILKPNLVAWLNRAFSKGPHVSGTVIFQGRLKDFPFERANGTFIVDSDLQDLDFNYDDNWPPVQDIGGRLIFFKHSMKCLVQQAHILGAPISSIVADIPYIGKDKNKPTLLTLHGTVKSDAAQLLKFVHQSPLKTLLGSDWDKIHMKGKTDLDLFLKIPVEQPQQTFAEGRLNFQSVQLRLMPLAVPFENLMGSLHFTNQGTAEGVLKARLIKTPMTFSIFTTRTKKNSIIQTHFSNDLSIIDLEKLLGRSISNLKGKVSYRAILKLYPFSSDRTKNNLTFYSDLIGLQINLPEPFKKEFKEARPMRLSIAPGKKSEESIISMIMEGHLNLTAFLQKDQIQKIHMIVDKLSLGGQIFKNTVLDIESRNKNWEVQINNVAVRGQLLISQQKNNEPIIGNFSRLFLNPHEMESLKIPSVASIPPLQIRAQYFSYQGKNLGQLSLMTHNELSTLVVDQLSLDSSLFSAHLKGQWIQNDHDKCELSGTIDIYDLDRWLKEWDWNIGLTGKTGQGQFGLNWDGPLYDPIINSIRGNMNLQLGSGRVIAVDKSSAAKLNMGFVLSLLSLRRLMSMDFFHWSQKGFQFNELKGKFTWQPSGIIQTESFYLDGPIARINVKGVLLLLQKQLNLNIIIIPYITSSLPILAAVTFNPIAGVVTWIADKFLGREVGKLAQYHYRVTGNWSHPTIQEVK